MGLERISSVLNGVLSNYDTELFIPLLRTISEMAGIRYSGTMEASDVSMRVVADHMRAMTFLIADGVAPSNEWRGYVLRKIMRRAMRHGRKIGFTQPFLYKLVDVLVADMGQAYPEIKSNRDSIVRVIESEEARFGVVLADGLPRLEDILDQAARGNRIVPGEQAFKLYDTYGLPRDFIEDLTTAQGLQFDAAGFDSAMEGQREKARAKSAFDTGGKREEFTFSSDAQRAQLAGTGDTFEGYTTTSVGDDSVVALFDENRQQVDALAAGTGGFAVLARTPFYLESGGQVSDRGRLTFAGGHADVSGVVRPGPGLPRAHRLERLTGSLRVNDRVQADVDGRLRDATRRNHTATHLLHAALRRVLGSHVKQAGSLVAPDRLRFDFVAFEAVTPAEIARIERIVNEQILGNSPVQTDVRSTDEAIAGGAMALFGEKYGDRVRVVTVPGVAGDTKTDETPFSVELCGGTHVRATGDIGLFLITEESGVAAGVRRIEAVTGLGAYAFARERLDRLSEATRTLNAKPQDLADAINAHLASESKLKKEVQQLKTKLALGGGSGTGATGDEQVEFGGVTLISRRVDDVDKESLRSLADTLKSRLTSGIVVLAAPSAEGKVTIIATVTPDLVKRTPAGQLVKQLAPIVGGGGGGRADFAEAGGKDPSKIGEMLAEARKIVQGMLAAN